MKEYFVITKLDNTLVFNYRTLVEEETVFINKNNYYKDSLYYDLKYYKKHIKQIVELFKNGNINSIKIMRLVTFKYPVELIQGLNIENIVLDFDSTLSLSDYDLFLESSSIKKIFCYYMPKSISNEFIKRGCEVTFSKKINISDRFLLQQESIDIDTLYYKKVIKIEEEYPGVMDDLKEFLKVNYNLKAIHIYTYSKSLIEAIVNLVKNDESKNVIVYLHQGYDKGDFIVSNFEWLKGISNSCKESYTCEFRIIYANSFLRRNLFKQLTFNNLKMASILCIYVCVVSLIIVKSYDYIEQINVEQMRNKILSDASNTIENSFGDIDELNEEEEEYSPEVEDRMEDANKLTEKEISDRYTFTPSIKNLKKLNKEVKGYLIVRDTKISYPVVQHSDNNYYLKHDIYNRKTSIGSLFFDYRNNVKKLDDNTIIYGHSMLNGTMFGTLRKVSNSSWRKDEDNLIVSLTTEKGTLKFKIFSVYKVDYTTDYLRVNFNSKKEKEKFIKLITKRSSFKSNTKVGVDDKILTMSTCTGGNNRRLVVHAVLMKEEKKEKE